MSNRSVTKTDAKLRSWSKWYVLRLPTSTTGRKVRTANGWVEENDLSYDQAMTYLQRHGQARKQWMLNNLLYLRMGEYFKKSKSAHDRGAWFISSISEPQIVSSSHGITGIPAIDSMWAAETPRYTNTPVEIPYDMFMTWGWKPSYMYGGCERAYKPQFKPLNKTVRRPTTSNGHQYWQQLSIPFGEVECSLDVRPLRVEEWDQDSARFILKCDEVNERIVQSIKWKWTDVKFVGKDLGTVSLDPTDLTKEAEARLNAWLAVATLQPSVGSGSDMPDLYRSTLELKDVPETIGTIYGTTRGLIATLKTKDFVRGFGEFVQWLGKGRLTKWLAKRGMRKVRVATLSIRTAIALYLTYKYGIQPTASDVKAVLGVVRTCMEQPVLSKIRYVGRGAVVRSGYRLLPTDLNEKLEDALKHFGPPVKVIRRSGSNVYRFSTTAVLDEIEDEHFVFDFQGDVNVIWPDRNALLNGAPVTVQVKGIFAPQYSQVRRWISRLGCAQITNCTSVNAVVFGRMMDEYYSDGLADATKSLRWHSPLMLSTAWELLPLSFLVDFYVSVGNKIRTLERATSTLGMQRYVTDPWINRVQETDVVSVCRQGVLRAGGANEIDEASDYGSSQYVKIVSGPGMSTETSVTGLLGRTGYVANVASLDYSYYAYPLRREVLVERNEMIVANDVRSVVSAGWRMPVKSYKIGSTLATLISAFG